MKQGESLALQRLLLRRFGALPTPILQRISEAEVAQIEAWFDRVLDVNSLDELFGGRGT